MPGSYERLDASRNSKRSGPVGAAPLWEINLRNSGTARALQGRKVSRLAASCQAPATCCVAAVISRMIAHPPQQYPAHRAGPGRPARRGAARALPVLQRGVRQHRRPEPAPRRPRRRGDPADPAAARTRRRPGGDWAAGADAAYRRPRPDTDRPLTAKWCRWPNRTAPPGGAVAVALIAMTVVIERSGFTGSRRPAAKAGQRVFDTPDQGAGTEWLAYVVVHCD